MPHPLNVFSLLHSFGLLFEGFFLNEIFWRFIGWPSNCVSLQIGGFACIYTSGVAIEQLEDVCKGWPDVEAARRVVWSGDVVGT